MSNKSLNPGRFEPKSKWSVIDTLLEGKGPGDVERPVRSQISGLVEAGIIPREKRQDYDRSAFAAQYYLKLDNEWLRQAPEFDDKWSAASWLVREKEKAGESKAVETLMRSLEYGQHVPRDDPQYHWTAAAADRASSKYIQQLVQDTKTGKEFCSEVQDNWNEVRLKVQDTYHQRQPPEEPWSQSYCYDIRRAAKFYLEAKEENKEDWQDFLD